MTDVVRIDPAHPDLAALARAADRLRDGALVAFPTETVYGLGAHACDRLALRRLFEAKGRPATDPLIVHVPTLGDVAPLVERLPRSAHDLAAAFWPGPLTIILRRSALIPDEVTAGLDTVAIRVPAHPIAQALLQLVGRPVAAPSANLFSRPSPTRASHVMDDLAGRIDLVIDGGPTSLGVESTVLDLSREVPIVLRPGAVTAELLRAVIPGVTVADPIVRPEPGLGMASPGLLLKHYSPRAPLTLYEGSRALDTLLVEARMALDRGASVGILAATEDQRRLATLRHARLDVRDLGSLHDPSRVAANLYALVRELDRLPVDAIFVRGFPTEEGLGIAIQDRLRRAAAGRIITT